MSRQMKAQSNWRGELNEYAGVLSGYNNYGDLDQQHAKTDTKARKEIKEKPVKNKIVINPVVKEAFAEIGAVVLDISEEAVVEELSKEDIEELQRKKDAKDGKKPGKVDEDSKWIQKATKNMRKDKPCTGDKFGSDTCPPGSKRYNLAKTFKKMAKEEAMNENSQTNNLVQKRAMLDVKIARSRKKDQKQVQRDPANEMAVESMSVADQMRVSREYFKNRKPKSAEEKNKEDKIKAKNYADNKKNRDPYKSRAGESD
jgi:hypothetical protein